MTRPLHPTGRLSAGGLRLPVTAAVGASGVGAPARGALRLCADRPVPHPHSADRTRGLATLLRAAGGRP